MKPTRSVWYLSSLFIADVGDPWAGSCTGAGCVGVGFGSRVSDRQGQSSAAGCSLSDGFSRSCCTGTQTDWYCRSHVFHPSFCIHVIVCMFKWCFFFAAAVELAVHTLDEAAVYFSQLDCKERMRDIHYLQARLHHSLGNISQRNKCAMLFRLLDQELPSSGMTVFNRL